MHHLTKKKIVGELESLRGQDVLVITDAVKAHGEYTEEEVQEIVLALSTPTEKEEEINPNLQGGVPKAKKLKASELCKEEFYEEDGIPKRKVNNDNWREYKKAEDAMNGMKSYDFIKVKAIGVFEKTVDANGNVVTALKGITLTKDKAVCTTRMMASHARLLNNQIYNSPNNKEASVYFLLADKVEM